MPQAYHFRVQHDGVPAHDHLLSIGVGVEKVVSAWIEIQLHRVSRPSPRVTPERFPSRAIQNPPHPESTPPLQAVARCAKAQRNTGDIITYRGS
jgi:hypothetical protein